MKRVASIAAMIATIIFSGATAQATPKTFVVVGGSTTSNCSALAPCATFAYAYANTDDGGEIVCLGSGQFGNVTINKSITINCLGALAATGAGGNAGNLDVSTAASNRVVLRGLDIQTNSGTASQITGAGTLVLDQVKISSNAVNGNSALTFAPSGAGKLVVTDSLFTNGGASSSGAGILIAPQPGGTAQVTLERVTVAGNAFGIAVDGTNSTGGINVTISDSVTTSNAQDGILATSSASTAPIGVFLTNVKSTNNGYGVRSIGSNVTVRLEGSRIIGNGIGLSGGGALLSAGNNIVEANATNGAFTGSVGFK